jgi:hypothetical protein
MKLADVKNIKVGDKSFAIKLTNRAMIEYEAMTGETMVNLQGSERLSKLFYCTAKAGARSAGHEFKYTYEQFLDVIDDFYLDVLNNFTTAMVELFGTPSEETPGKK